MFGVGHVAALEAVAFVALGGGAGLFADDVALMARGELDAVFVDEISAHIAAGGAFVFEEGVDGAVGVVGEGEAVGGPAREGFGAGGVIGVEGERFRRGGFFFFDYVGVIVAESF